MKTTKTANPDALDFNRWSEMSKADPDLFEKMRLEAIEQAIAEASPENRERLRCLQWRIEQERRSSDSPMGACIRIYRMMWERVGGPGGLLECLRNPLEQPQLLNTMRDSESVSKIVPLKPR
ncbi:MAG: DUF3135 domain-containing protein [Gammaproteobacteria bacterium]|nr:DUF3135 domain-containing protein [Gammaproteobacteria bacterium]